MAFPARLLKLAKSVVRVMEGTRECLLGEEWAEVCEVVREREFEDEGGPIEPGVNENGVERVSAGAGAGVDAGVLGDAGSLVAAGEALVCHGLALEEPALAVDLRGCVRVLLDEGGLE